MKDNGNRIIPTNSTLLFSDGTKMSVYWSKRGSKDKIYNLITAENNQINILYKDQCEVLIKAYKDYKKKKENQLSDEEKLSEYLQAIKDNNNKIIRQRDNNKTFSNNKKMNQYWFVNKDKIYKMITEEGNQFVAQYKDQCEVLIKEYNKKQLSEEEKIFEYLQAIKENGNKIIPHNSTLLFSDGIHMNQYWGGNKNKIYKLITEEGNQFIVQYKEQCEVLIKAYKDYQKKQAKKITDKEKLLEYLQRMKENGNRIIFSRSSLLFSDETQMAQYWNRAKNKIYKMITEEGNQFVIQYKDQCEVLIKEYNKKTLSNDEKLLEYFQAIKENCNNTIPPSSSLLFSDGTKMSIYWRDKKDKIYIMIMEEGNPFIVQYKEQCEVLINKYIKFQERKQQNKEQYIKVEEAFREESLFDKTLKNTKGKKSNDGKKVL